LSSALSASVAKRELSPNLQAARPVAVEARHIALAYGKTAVLRDVSLAIEPGEFFALLGPSGSGKSTLLRLIAGFARQQSGQLLIDGREVGDMPPWQRNVGMVFQNYALWPHMTVAQNVAFGLEERRLPRATVRGRVAAVLEMVDLTAFAARRPGQLSGGQQQRVAIARTLAIEPQVLLLDEPLSNLDARLRIQTRQELVKLQRRLGLTTIFVTHDQEEALTTCRRIAVMDQGVIQQIGTPQQLFDQPANRFVARFVGSVNLFTGQLAASDGEAAVFENEDFGRIELPRATKIPAALAAPRDGTGAVDLAFRPHAVTLSVRGDQQPFSLSGLPARHGPGQGNANDGVATFDDGRIETIEFLGEFERYSVRVGGALVTADVSHHRGREPLAAGTWVRIEVPARELRLMAAT
jgi:iron(III) transport system ATP-binding protein